MLPFYDNDIRLLKLQDIILSTNPKIRNISLAEYCANVDFNFLLEQCEELDRFRRKSKNLYQTVRALFFLYSIHRFHLKHKISKAELIPYEGYKALLARDFDGAIEHFLSEMHSTNPSEAISSALASAYVKLGFQTLADQVKISVKNHPGNSWMFLMNQAVDHPKSMHHQLLDGIILRESTPVRMDLSHCGWSDIFFLGMDFPEAARVLNISIDLAVRGRHNFPTPPIDSYIRVIDEPVLILTSIDLKATVTLKFISEVFNFAKDYLGLLRAGIIASGIVPFGLEDSHSPLSELFDTLIGPGKGLELTTRVNDIPKGSRLAVSTNLLSSIIALGMRATGQTRSLSGELTEEERRLVAARAILGEWLGGSGGGWQDSGGIWPGIKLIQGVPAKRGDPEYGLSRGRLLPNHRQLSEVEAPESLIKALTESLVLVHGGMAQNVGPVLEMVTEKYLLRETDEWKARHDALDIFDEMLAAFRDSNVKEIAKLTTRNFFQPLQTIIPWATNLYTETIIERTRKRFGERFWGFWMLGGCSGGGMGFIFDPKAKTEALSVMQEIMFNTKQEMQHALPFAMDPVVYDFSVNVVGTRSQKCETQPTLNTESIGNDSPSLKFNGLSLDEILAKFGFDIGEHEKIRHDLKKGIIGLKQNRLPDDTKLTNVQPQDVILTEQVVTSAMRARGLLELKNGTVGVVTLAAGIGSRWTQGAGVVKAINPFCKLGGRYRSFLEVHLAKSRRVSQIAGLEIAHVFTTSHLTDDPITTYLARVNNHGYKGQIHLSPGRKIGLRLVPTIRDLKFAWEELQQQQLDEQAQKVRGSLQSALISWAKDSGEASDYRDNNPSQCLHPCGHFFEVPNLLLNGTLSQMLSDRPQMKYLMLHNIDTVGVDVDPGLLGLFLEGGKTLSFEVVPRCIEDQGGGLAKVNDTIRLVEGLALPREEDEFSLSYYNSMTTWIDIDKLLATFNLDRGDLSDTLKVANNVHQFARRLPTYVTLKEAKNRWGNGQEDVYPVAQFEKLWSDMSSLNDVSCQFFVVPRKRGQQLKEISQLDGWLRDGSAEYLENICSWE
mmetsp:Transcript_46194/g.90216  ORF Transcript_46194/g.90216 Transcript_46194/m.90216 type:complete len:1060 (+) Transcript_46194:63-3242(+)